MKSYREWKLDEANVYQQFRNTGAELGTRGALKLGAIVDSIVAVASNKKNLPLLKKIINYLKAAIQNDPDAAQYITQLNTAANVLVRSAARPIQPEESPTETV